MKYQSVIFFKHINANTPIEEIKAQYLDLCRKHHPDMGGRTEDMQQINAEYMYLNSTHSHIHRSATGETYEKASEEMPEKFMDLISALIKFKGIDIEVIGRFVWVSGNTKTIKDELKGLGLLWSGNRKMWYYAAGKRSKFHSNLSFDEIRSYYGSSFHAETEKPQGIEA